MAHEEGKDSGTLKTPLHDEHVRLGAKLIPFGGWRMPVSYDSVLKEHETVRTACGIFDVSHMGEVEVGGANALEFLQYLTINDVKKLAVGLGHYSAMLRPDGGMIDDIILYRTGVDRFLICVNAANRAKDVEWIMKHAANADDLEVRDASDDYAQIAVQGPTSLMAVSAILDDEGKRLIQDLPYTGIVPIRLFGESAWLARTGYTGERGYELYIPKGVAIETWRALLATAAETGVKPIGLGARDTLRLEACYLLYGNDMDESVSPLEAGIGWAAKLDKGDFIGRDALLGEKAKGVARHIVAFKMEEQAIPRHGMEIYAEAEGGSPIGKVTSGSVLPTVGGSGGLALMSGKTEPGTPVYVDVRGKRKLARIVKKPLYAARVRD